MGFISVFRLYNEDYLSSFFCVSILFFFFCALALSWWLVDFWVVHCGHLRSEKNLLNFFVLLLAFFLFFSPSLFFFFFTDFFFNLYIPVSSGFFSFFGSFDNLSILFVFMVHIVDGLTLLFLLLYFQPTNLQLKESMRLYVWAIFLMTLVLDCLFLSTNFLVMFFVAEFSLFPLSFLLLKENTIFWRSSNFLFEEGAFESKRPLAFYYLALFTVVSGGFGMIGLIIIYFFFGDLSFISFKGLFASDLSTSFILVFASEEIISLYLSIFLILLWIAVKVPLVPVHIWLPKAHVEGSTESSMLLAGIILKITTYILIRLSSCWFFFYFFSVFETFFLVMSVTTAILGALGALSTVDLKRLAAYSSVSHMGIILVSGFLLSTSSFAIQPYIILLMTHTLISTSMFFVIGCIYKLRLKNVISRNRLTYSGLLYVYPYFFLIGLIFFANLNIPLTLGFAGELGVLVSAVQLGFSTIFFVLFGSFLLLIPMLMLIAQVLLGPLKTSEFFKYNFGFSSYFTQELSTTFVYYIPLKIYSDISYTSVSLTFHGCIKFVLCGVSFLSVFFGICPFVFSRLSCSLLNCEIILLNSSSFFLFSSIV